MTDEQEPIPISLEESKMLATRFFQLLPEVGDHGNVDALDEVLAESVKVHGTAGAFENREQFKDAVRTQANALTDNAIVMHHVIAEGDVVSATFTHAMTILAKEFMGIPSAGKRVAFTGTAKLCVAEGKVNEIWIHEDIPALQTQLLAPEA